MAPRKYVKGERAITTEETRRRILEASLALHGEKGFEATSWKDIADRADVAVGTVYYHFPTLAELAPACGALAEQRAGFPDVRTLEGIGGRANRISAVTRGVFDYFNRVGPGFANLMHERHRIPVVNELALERERACSALIRKALGKDVPASIAKRIEALIDFRVWDSFRSRGIGQEVTISIITSIIQDAISGAS